MQAVVETQIYLRDAKNAGLSEEERAAIVDFVAANPEAGDAIQGTGGARKIRFAGRSTGKRGGYRVVTFFGGADMPVFLLNVFSKTEKSDLTQAERNEFKATLAALAQAYRRRK